MRCFYIDKVSVSLYAFTGYKSENTHTNMSFKPVTSKSTPIEVNMDISKGLNEQNATNAQSQWRIAKHRPVRTISAEAVGAYDYGPNGEFVPYVYRGSEITTGIQVPFANLQSISTEKVSDKSDDEAAAYAAKRAKFWSNRARYWEAVLASEYGYEEDELVLETPENKNELCGDSEAKEHH